MDGLPQKRAGQKIVNRWDQTGSNKEYTDILFVYSCLVYCPFVGLWDGVLHGDFHPTKALE